MRRSVLWMRCGRAALLVVLACWLAIAGGARARGDVPPGSDLFETDPQATVFHFQDEFIIPAGFFAPGSAPFSGSVLMGGEPLGRVGATRVGDADTVVRRPQAAAPDGTIPVEIVSLSLVSVEPIRIRVGGATQLWDVRAELSPARPSEGSMTVRQPAAGGGTFDSTLQVFPRFRFTRLTDRVTRTIDVGSLTLSTAALQDLTLKTAGTPWRAGCAPPALVVSLNAGFCPSFDQDEHKVLSAEQGRLARHGVRPAQPMLDHYKCYRARSPKDTPGRVVGLTDQFGASRQRVLGPLRLCAPARKNAEAVEHPEAHLQCYAIRRVGRRPRIPGAVWIRNQFGPARLQVGERRALCAPALKRVAKGGAPPGLPQLPATDHFTCYSAHTLAVAGLPRAAHPRVTLVDQFGRERVAVGAVRELCAPTRKDREALLHPVRHLVCYAIRDPSLRRLVDVRDQFGTRRLRLESPERLCVPSLKVWRPSLPPVEPPPGEPTPPPTTTTPPPATQPAFSAQGRWSSTQQPDTAGFTVSFSQDVDRFTIVLAGGRQVVGSHDPAGLTCTTSDGDGDGHPEMYHCAGAIAAGVTVTGELAMQPQPAPAMGGQLLAGQGSTTFGPFAMQGP